MNITLFKETFDPLLARHLASKQVIYGKITGNKSVLSVLEHIKKISLGGKRLRPYMIWLLYSSSIENSRIEDISDVLIAIELFHVFCLIHDDIMDEAQTRHAVPTIHTYTKEIFTEDTPAHIRTRAGESQAILAGDILFNQVYELMNNTPWKNEDTRKKVQSVFITLVNEVCIGQMLDVHLTTQKETTLENVAEKNRLKTAFYSFARPLHISAILSGREDLIDFVLAFGEKSGMLFQIQDDLLDIVGKKENTKKELFVDIAKNQHTELTEYIRKQADETYGKRLDALSGTNITESDTEEIEKIFAESGAITHARKLIETYSEECLQLIQEKNLSKKDTQVFTQILSLLKNRTS